MRLFTSLRYTPRRHQSEKPLFYFKEINLDLRPLQMAAVTRRQFLKTAMLVSASGVWAKHFAMASTVSWHERRDLFPEGVASGDPNSNSVLLWTRRAPEGQPPPSHLTLEVAEDQDFHRVVATQNVPISADADWTCPGPGGRAKVCSGLLVSFYRQRWKWQSNWQDTHCTGRP